MKNCKQILTERLVLEPFCEKYLTDRYVSWLNDPDIVRYSENRYKIHTLESCRIYFESFINSPNCFWAVTIADSGKHIGNINAYVNIPNSIADLGIMIGDKSSQGKGYAFEAWCAVIDFMLDKCGVRKVTAGTMSENGAMLKIMRNSGMTNDGIRKNHYLLDGREVDIVHMATFKMTHKYMEHH